MTAHLELLCLLLSLLNFIEPPAADMQVIAFFKLGTCAERMHVYRAHDAACSLC